MLAHELLSSVRQGEPMNTLLQDLRFALRQMRRSPGFAMTAVFILGLGIAANVIVMGVVQALVLQPLDAPRPDRVVTFANREQGYPNLLLSRSARRARRKHRILRRCRIHV